MSNWRIASESGNTREWRSSPMEEEDEHRCSSAIKRCLTCGKVIPNTPTGKRPTKTYCSLKCRPKPPRKTECAKEKRNLGGAHLG